VLLALLLFIVCAAILLVKGINPQVKAVARNVVIMLIILLVVFLLVGFFGFYVAQRGNSLKLSNNVDYMLSTPNK